jgi:hypothetical protein
MTTQDLIDYPLAAKAAGYVLTFKHGSCKGGAYFGAFIERGGELVAWRPKEDDGDSRRLEVKLRLEASWWRNAVLVETEDQSFSSGIVSFGEDPLEATRFAVFRCAVEIGRDKQ